MSVPIATTSWPGDFVSRAHEPSDRAEAKKTDATARSAGGVVLPMDGGDVRLVPGERATVMFTNNAASRVTPRHRERPSSDPPESFPEWCSTFALAGVL